MEQQAAWGGAFAGGAMATAICAYVGVYWAVIFMAFVALAALASVRKVI